MPRTLRHTVPLHSRPLEIVYARRLDGGGAAFLPSYVTAVRSLFGKVGRVHEFCAGLGLIGFGLLAEGLCDSLCLSEINPEAVRALRETVRRNGLEDRVSVYRSDGLKGIPTNERWDLVVANPPHFRAETRAELRASIKRYDYRWTLHRQVFGNMRRFLAPGGSVLVLENYQGSEEKVFKPLLARGGLRYLGSFMALTPEPNSGDTFYFLWAKRDDEALIWEESPVRTLRFAASELQGLEVRLAAEQKIRLEVRNDTRRRLRLDVVDGRGRPIFQDPVLDAPPGSRGRGHVFYLHPGTYGLKAQDSSALLAILRAQA